jgi:hypothetical protein
VRNDRLMTLFSILSTDGDFLLVGVMRRLMHFEKGASTDLNPPFSQSDSYCNVNFKIHSFEERTRICMP